MTFVRNWNEVEMMFRDKAFKYANPNMLILPKKEALEFIDKCKKNKIPIWGIDSFLTGKYVEPTNGYTYPEGSVQPVQDYSIDFSLPPFKYDVYNVDEIYDRSTALIKKSPDHMYFEIGCEETG